MKPDKIIDAIGKIDTKYVDEITNDKKKAKRVDLKKALIAAAFVTVIAALTVALVMFGMNRGGDNPTVPDVTSDDRVTVPVDNTDGSLPTDDQTTEPEPGTDPANTTDPVETTRNIGGGEEGVCPVHDTEPYHAISGLLIDMVGGERFEEWLESLPEEYDDNGCTDPVNIVSFIQYFKLTDEQICDFAYGPDYYNWV
ncbi:MAG: hypothetical protein IJT91_08980, partial [Clostridia bacterium]|nr:hypothetical protein [Clostridia bacterium]